MIGNTVMVIEVLRRSLIVLCAIALALLWIALGARPAFAIDASFLRYSNSHLENQDFSRQDLAGGVFVAAEMRGTNFSGANLTNAMFTKGNLLGANLQGANLTGSLLDRATLYKANLSDANLTESTLSNSILDDADITGTDFTDAILDRYTVTQLCKRAAGKNSTTGVSTRDSLGCR